MLSRCVPLVVAGMLSGCGSSGDPVDAALDERPPLEDTAAPADGPATPTVDAPVAEPSDAAVAASDGTVPVGACALSACGGSPVGSWNVTATCYNPGRAITAGGCPQPRSTDSSGLATTGQMTFNADGSYTMAFTTSGPQVVAYDFGCDSPSPATCPDLQASLTPKDPADHTAVTCSQSGTLCTCTLTYQDSPDSEEGTFTVNAKTISLSAKGFTMPYTRQLCVSGATMKMTLPLSSGGDFDGVHSLTKR